MQAVVYNLIMVTGHLFMGQYNSFGMCNDAIRAIYEKQYIPNPDLIPKSEIPRIQKSIDIAVKYQREYLCVGAQ